MLGALVGSLHLLAGVLEQQVPKGVYLFASMPRVLSSFSSRAGAVWHADILEVSFMAAGKKVERKTQSSCTLSFQAGLTEGVAIYASAKALLLPKAGTFVTTCFCDMMESWWVLLATEGLHS